MITRGSMPKANQAANLDQNHAFEKGPSILTRARRPKPAKRTTNILEPWTLAMFFRTFSSKDTPNAEDRSKPLVKTIRNKEDK